jgi:hypothetical protein
MAKANIRKAKRAGHDACEICNYQTLLELHHLRGRNIPNAHKDFNLVWICANCHTEIHAGLIIVEGWFKTNFGRELFWHKKGEVSITGKECKVYLTN